jgi:ectoine hydroxylase-related dioxygenase (phytanoyl-CoA dioxygenase family)
MNERPLQPVTEADIRTYENDGVVCVRGAFDRAWIDLLSLGFNRVAAEKGPDAADHAPEEGAGRFFTDIDLARRDADFARYVHASPAAEIVSVLMRSTRINFFFDTAWAKGPGVRKRTNWHQDQPYFTINGSQNCTLWLPLDPAAAGIALEFVCGSHRWGRWFDPLSTTDAKPFFRDCPYEPIPDIERDRAAYDIVSWDVEPGDCLVFHGLTVHGAGGNPQAAAWRRAHSSNWLGDDMVFASRPGETRPAFEKCGLKEGDPMDNDFFPRVWPRPDNARERARQRLRT